MIKARRFLLSGRVQGVGFRFFARDAACREGLTGFVRNLPDGRVQLEAEGEQDSLDRFERCLHEGPSTAQVENIVVEEILQGGRAESFRIKAD